MKNALTAKRLSDTLNACGLTAKELSEKSGVSKNSISQYMNGVHAPSNISAGKMAKVLGVYRQNLPKKPTKILPKKPPA